MLIAHIRRRTHGPVGLPNTHPFTRELWGRAWVFAHNGTLADTERLLVDRFQPVGETDSERGFCWLMSELARRFPSSPPPPDELAAAIADLGSELSRHGVCNFLLGDGHRLYARCDTRLHHLVRQAPFGQATLADEDMTIDFARVTSPGDRVAVVATNPLTRDERWTTGQPGTLWVFHRGALVAELPSPVLHAPVEHPVHVMPAAG